MSITLGTLLILFFLIPGLVFRKAFFVLPFDKRYNEGKSISELGIILIVSLVIHSLALLVMSWWLPDHFSDFKGLLEYTKQVMLNNGSSELISFYLDKVNLGVIVVSQFVIWGVSALFGFMFNSVVRSLKWDRKYRSFRFGNSWYYYFSGEAIEFPDIGGDAKQIDYVFVDVLVKTETKEVLYIGVLSEYHLSNNGGLKSIALKGAKRRFLTEKDKYLSSEEREELSEDEILSKYYTIPSNLFVIPYNENVVNVNFRYFADDDDDKPESDSTSKLEAFLRYISLAFIVIFVITIIIYLITESSSKDGEKEKDEDSEDIQEAEEVVDEKSEKKGGNLPQKPEGD